MSQRAARAKKQGNPAGADYLDPNDVVSSDQSVSPAADGTAARRRGAPAAAAGRARRGSGRPAVTDADDEDYVGEVFSDADLSEDLGDPEDNAGNGAGNSSGPNISPGG
ncbi:hypothetical protein MNEG_16662, partial [Monoraphidium neglectum]